jgi:hypothetical protein
MRAARRRPSPAPNPCALPTPCPRPPPPGPCGTPQIAETMVKFTETLAAKQKEADEFGAKHRITSQGSGGGGAAAAAAPSEGEGSQGVLI